MLQLGLLHLLLVCIGTGAIDDGPVGTGKGGNGRDKGGGAGDGKKNALHFQLQMGGTSALHRAMQCVKRWLKNGRYLLLGQRPISNVRHRLNQ